MRVCDTYIDDTMVPIRNICEASGVEKKQYSRSKRVNTLSRRTDKRPFSSAAGLLSLGLKPETVSIGPLNNLDSTQNKYIRRTT